MSNQSYREKKEVAYCSKQTAELLSKMTGTSFQSEPLSAPYTEELHTKLINLLCYDEKMSEDIEYYDPPFEFSIKDDTISITDFHYDDVQGLYLSSYLQQKHFFKQLGIRTKTYYYDNRRLLTENVPDQAMRILTLLEKMGILEITWREKDFCINHIDMMRIIDITLNLKENQQLGTHQSRWDSGCLDVFEMQLKNTVFSKWGSGAISYFLKKLGIPDQSIRGNLTAGDLIIDTKALTKNQIQILEMLQKTELMMIEKQSEYIYKIEGCYMRELLRLQYKTGIFDLYKPDLIDTVDKRDQNVFMKIIHAIMSYFGLDLRRDENIDDCQDKVSVPKKVYGFFNKGPKTPDSCINEFENTTPAKVDDPVPVSSL